MAFNAGAVIAKIILDSSNFINNSEKVTASTNTMAGAFNTITGLVVAAAKEIIRFGTESVKKADEWRKSFSNVTTVVDTTKVNVQKMAKEILLLNPALGSSIDLTNGLYQALSASVDPAKSVQFVAESAKFAQAALVDTNTAVDVITTGLNAYGMQAEKATDISDKFFKVIMLGKITGEQLASTIGKSIPLAANMGITIDELGATLAVMTRQGIKASQATTQFNSMVSAFIKPSEDMSKTIKALGYESGEAMIKQLGFKGAIDAVVKSTGGSNEQMGKLFRNVNALKGVMAITGQGASDFNDILNKIQNSTGATNTAFEKQEKTFQTFKNSIDTLMIVIGNVGKIFVDDIARGATLAAEGMIKFLMSAQGAEIVSEVIAQAAAGFETLKKIIEPLINQVFKEGKKIWDDTSKALDKMFGVTNKGAGGFNLLAVMGQLASSAIKVISLVIQGAIDSIVNFVEAIKNANDVINYFFDALTGKRKWEEVKEAASKTMDAFSTLTKNNLANMEEIWNTVVEESKTFSDRVKNQATDLEITYTTTYANIKNNTKNAYMEMITGQENFAQQTIDNMNNVDLSIQESINGQIQNEETKKQFMLTTENIILEAQNQAVRDAAEYQEKVNLESQEKIKKQAQETANFVISTFSPIAEALGGVILQQEGSWENLKKAALNALASIIEGFAQKWTLLAVEAGLTLNIPAAIGYGGLATAGYIAAGAIKGLKQGGIGSGLTLVGEAGPELVDFRSPARVYNNSETNNLLSPSINMNNTFVVRDSKDIDLINMKLGDTIQRSMRRV